MSSKEIIKNQLEKFSTPAVTEHFLSLSEGENSLILLEITVGDYTLTDIARIVESNSALVMSLNVVPISDSSLLWISLKLNVNDPSHVLRSFERFNYNVLYYEAKVVELEDIQKARLDELLHYLEM